MSNPTWPVSLPQSPAVNGFSRIADSNIVSTSINQGYDRRRKRFTRSVKRFSVTLPPLSFAQLQTLDTFYDTTLNCGVTVFDWNDFTKSPRVAASYRFGLDGLTVTALTTQLWRVSFTLEMEPQ